MSDLSVRVAEGEISRKKAMVLTGEIREPEQIEMNFEELERKNSTAYWSMIMLILADVGDYCHKAELCRNASDEGTYWKVKRVIEDYYGGKIEAVRRDRDRLRAKLRADIEGFNKFSEKLGIPETSETEFITLGGTAKARNRARNAVRNHLAKFDTPFPVSEIPKRDYKKRS